MIDWSILYHWRGELSLREWRIKEAHAALPKKKQKMSTPMEEATASLQHATESLRRAEDRLNNFMNQNPQDFTSAGFLALSAEVARCTAVLAGALLNDTRCSAL